MKWECISMDFVIGLLKLASGLDSIFVVVVDNFTKVSHLILVRTNSIAAKVAHLFVKEILWLHNILARIISDCDAKFTSKFWQALFQ